ncbi:hypothetical protein [Azotobacter vinelandii]
MVALDLYGDSDVAVAELEEVDDSFDARPGCRIRQAQALTGTHLHELAPAQHQGWQEIHSNWDTISSMPPRYGTEHLDRQEVAEIPPGRHLPLDVWRVQAESQGAPPKKSGMAVRRPVSRSKAENYRIAVFGLATTGVCNYLARG